MMGYFISFLRNELLKHENYNKRHKNVLLTLMSPQIFMTISELFMDIFGESISKSYLINNKDDLKKTLNEIFEMVSEKIQRGGESFLEISYLCGGLISLTETEETIPADKRKYEIIIAHLLTILELNLCWSDLNNIIDELISCEIQSRRQSRDQLFYLICGSQIRHKKVFEIQNLLETNSFYQNTAFA